MNRRMSGFTIVEIAIVITVIAILSAITIATYNGVQDKAHESSLKSDLTQAAKQMTLEKRFRSDYSVNMLPDIRPSKGNVLQLTKTAPDKFCMNGYGPNGSIMSITSDGDIKNQSCPGVLISTPAGGTIPPVPTNTNLVSDFSNWEVNGGVTYNKSTDQICLNSTPSGSALSPMIRIVGSVSAKFEVQAYATQSSPTGTPNSQGYYGSKYYQTDGVTPQTNTAGWPGNGNAQNLPLSVWTNHSWTTPTGNGIAYVQFGIHSAPSSRTSNNCYRNPKVTAVMP